MKNEIARHQTSITFNNNISHHHSNHKLKSFFFSSFQLDQSHTIEQCFFCNKHHLNICGYLSTICGTLQEQSFYISCWVFHSEKFLNHFKFAELHPTKWVTRYGQDSQRSLTRSKVLVYISSKILNHKKTYLILHLRCILNLDGNVN